MDIIVFKYISAGLNLTNFYNSDDFNLVFFQGSCFIDGQDLVLIREYLLGCLFILFFNLDRPYSVALSGIQF